MAQFIAFNPDAEVDGGTVLAFVNSMRRGQEVRQEILAKHNVSAQIGQWYSQQLWLDAFKEVAETLGEMNLFLIARHLWAINVIVTMLIAFSSAWEGAILLKI